MLGISGNVHQSYTESLPRNPAASPQRTAYQGGVTITHFRVFRDIVQTNSVSRGARMNHISQSAASQSLRHLESRLQVDLFDRSTRPFKLTEAGRVYYEGCRDIVRRYEEMESKIDSLKHELAGTVRVAFHLLHRPV